MNPEDLQSVMPAADGPTLVHIASALLDQPLLLHPTKAEVVLRVLQNRLGVDAAGIAPLSPDASRFIGTYRRESGGYGLSPATKGAAIISVVGALVNRGAWIGARSGLVSYEGVGAQIRDAVVDNEVHSIVLDIESPGGQALGVFALAQTIRDAKAVKPVIAVVNDMAASGAYALASAASEIVVSPSSLVGSIGVVVVHLDRSGEMEKAGVKPTLIYAGKHKVEGNGYGPLSAEVRDRIQTEVESLYEMFVGAVVTGRSGAITDQVVRDTEAATFFGEEAVRLGLADRVATLDAVLADLSSPRGGSLKTKGLTMSTDNNSPQVEKPAGITPEAHQQAVTAAVAGERARIAAIIRHPEAAGRDGQAAVLALDTEMSAEEAGKVLAASPKGGVIPSIAERAAAEAEVGSGQDAAKETSAQAAADKAWAKALGK